MRRKLHPYLYAAFYMAIMGVGIDIVETGRFAQGKRSERFWCSVFTNSERAYCQSKRSPDQHFAARFAAKEATIKALKGILPFISICQIEVMKTNEAPEISLISGRHYEPAPVLIGNITLHLSMSHSEHYATAVVIAETH